MKYLINYLKGMAMGAADVVPGVSGGTIAFITGILSPLLEGVRRINLSLIPIIKQQGLKAAFMHINGPFLVCVFGGILTSIFSLAKLISYLLATYPIPVWGFFFGLILASVLYMLRQVKRFTLINMALFVIGVAFAATITMITPIALEKSYLTFFFAGAIAICAMILPGISGSFILLLLGLYQAVLSAAKGFEVLYLACFASGCLVGLLSFSHVLSALLRRYYDNTLVFLTGLMLGTLTKIWPWKQTITWRTNSSGEQVPLIEQNLSPTEFGVIFNQDPQLMWAITFLIVGFSLVWGVEYLGKQFTPKTN